MARKKRKLAAIIDALAKAHGEPKPARINNPVELALHENVGYLVDDEKREAAFNALKKRIGTKPRQILGADPAAILEIAKMGGMLPGQRVEKLRRIAEIATEHERELESLAELSTAKAKRLLKRFPGIGDPGAEKILLFMGLHPFLALESNGLRALQRLGWAKEMKSYAASYKAAQEAAGPEIEETTKARMRAFSVLRIHGQKTCRRSAPLCDGCPVSTDCDWFRLL